MSDQDVYYRFLRSKQAFPREEMAAIVDIDYHYRMTILALSGESGFDNIVALGRYIAESAEGLAEIDIAVGQDFRRLGLGQAVLEILFEVARNKGFPGHQGPGGLRQSPDDHAAQENGL